MAEPLRFSTARSSIVRELLTDIFGGILTVGDSAGDTDSPSLFLRPFRKRIPDTLPDDDESSMNQRGRRLPRVLSQDTTERTGRRRLTPYCGSPRDTDPGLLQRRPRPRMPVSGLLRRYPPEGLHPGLAIEARASIMAPLCRVRSWLFRAVPRPLHRMSDRSSCTRSLWPLGWKETPGRPVRPPRT